MNRKSIVFSIMVVIILLVGCSQKSTKQPLAERGEMNLANWNINIDGTLPLSGEWEFYWKQLIAPSDLPNENIRTGFINVPSFWKGELNNTKLSGKGYATYRLHIGNLDVEKDELLGLYIPFGVESSYKVWVNGKLLATAGTVSTSNKSMVGEYLPQVVIFPSDQEIDLVIQVSNFVQRTGGLWDEIKFGRADDISSFRNKNLAEELFVAGAIIIMGIYHLGLYFIRRKDRSPLYFGGLCLLIGFRTLFLGEVYINQMLPNLDFSLYKKYEYIGQYVGPAMFMLYLYSLFPKEVHKIMVRILVVTYGILSFIVLVTPPPIFTYTLPISHILLLIYAPYIIYIFIVAAISKREGALFSCIMFFFMAITVVNDVLYYSKVIDTFDMSKFGLFVFIFAQAFLLSIKFSKAFKHVEELSAKQTKWSQELEWTVNERTKELTSTLENLQLAQKQLVESEKMAALGQLVAGVAHEINTPVGVSVTATTYLEQKTKEIQSILASNKMKKSDLASYINLANESTQIISHNLERASELIRSFKQVAVDQSNEVIREFNVKEYINEILVSLRPQLKTTNIEVTVNCLDSMLVSSYPGAISQIITNFVMNSLIHAYDPGATGNITISIQKDSKLNIHYQDDGKGMSEEVLSKVFDPFFTTNRLGGGTGLGMHIIYNLVTQSLGGTIECNSVLGKGTSFFIQIPLGQNN